MPDAEQASLSTTVELFEGLSDSACQTVLSTSYRREFSAMEMIYRAGEPRKTIFLLAEGRAKVGQVSQNGYEVLLWVNVSGQIIGALNLAARVHSSTARAVHCCKVLMWDLPVFEANLERFPTLLRNVQRIIDRQFIELSRRICEVTSGTVWVRLAHELTRLTEQLGRSVDGHIEIDITQEALAQMSAMTLFTVNRQLSVWERQGLVARRKNRIIIRDLPGLKRVCGNLVNSAA